MVSNKSGTLTLGAGTSRLAATGLVPPQGVGEPVELPEEVWAWVQADAERHGWSIAEEMVWIIREHFAARRQHIPLAERWSGHCH